MPTTSHASRTARSTDGFTSLRRPPSRFPALCCPVSPGDRRRCERRYQPVQFPGLVAQGSVPLLWFSQPYDPLSLIPSSSPPAALHAFLISSFECLPRILFCGEDSHQAYLLELQQRVQTSRRSISIRYQLHRSIISLHREGGQVEEYAQTPANLTAMGQNLFELINGRNIRLYAAPDLAAFHVAVNALSPGAPKTSMQRYTSLDELKATLRRGNNGG